VRRTCPQQQDDEEVVMSTTVTSHPAGQAPSGRSSAVQAAALRLYEAEVALHHARQTQVDEWIFAACERLHSAVEAYYAEITPQAA
jgi:hypothetical protein